MKQKGRLSMLTIFASDFHENATALDQILRHYHSEQLVLLGDYFDSRQGQTKQMATVLTDLMEGHYQLAHEPMLVRGNHDDFILGTIDGDELAYQTWLFNGGKQTLRHLGYRHSFAQQHQVSDFLTTNYAQVVAFLRQSQYLIETDEFIAVHGGLDWSLDDPRQTPDTDMTWLRDEYLGDLPAQPHPNLLNKVIVSGHTPVQNFQDTADIMTLQADAQDVPRYLIDGGSNSGMPTGHVNVLVLEHDERTHSWTNKLLTLSHTMLSES